MRKITYPESSAIELVEFSPVFLVTSSYEGKSNVLTVNWSAPVSFNPPILTIMIGQASYSHNLIENSREFVINIPDTSLLNAVKKCGNTSGRNVDKFLDAELSDEKPLKIKTPLIRECFANIECQIFRSFGVGDHTIFCGSVVSVLAEENVLLDNGVLNLEKHQPIMHIGQDQYYQIGGFIE